MKKKKYEGQTGVVVAARRMGSVEPFKRDGPYSDPKRGQILAPHDVSACGMRSVAASGLVQSCMSRSPPNIHLDGCPAVAFSFLFLFSL